MPNYFTLVPGYTFSANEPITIAKLNALGQPVVSPGADLLNLLATFKNLLVNGNFQVWQRTIVVGTSVSAPTGAKTFLADRWFVRPSGAAVTYAQDTLVPASADTVGSMKIIGAAGATTVDIGQRIESPDADSNCQRQLTYSASIFNGTGSSFSPNLVLKTPSAVDNYTTATIQINSPLPTLKSCPPGAWTRVSYTFDGSTFTNIQNGLEVALEIPSGSLANPAQSINLTDVQLERGGTASQQEGRSITMEYDLSQRYCLALKNQVIGFAQDATNLSNKGLFTLPTTMRVKPGFEGTAQFTDYTNTVIAGSTVAISGYASNVIFAVANVANNFTVNEQVNLTAVISAEDVSGA